MYKAFEKDLVNRYGQKYEINKIYETTGEIIFGNHGNGFHMCQNMEDTFRYYDFRESDSIITQVNGFGEFVEYEDDYYGYYNMYAYEKMEILKILTRDDIMEYFKTLNFNMQIERFLIGYKFTIEELYILKEHIEKVLSHSYMKEYLGNYQPLSYDKIIRMQ